MTPTHAFLEQQKLPVFQSLDSLDEAKNYIDRSLLRDETSNKVHTALAIYHNTLIDQLIKELPNEKI